MVSLVDPAYLVCLVGRDKPDEKKRPDEAIPRIDVSWSRVERRVGCAS
jgi:hypothetical protein